MGLWAIGDIHGCLRPLERLIEKISPGEGDKLIFLGDYIDRGPDSKGVVDFLIHLSKRVQCVFLRGNHEQMLLDVVDNNDDIFLWNLNGAQATIRSYGNLLELETSEEHMNFYRNTKYYHIEGNYLFVHGGVRPNVLINRQEPRDLIWIREEFIRKRHNLGFIVIFGHTPFEDVYKDADKIGIDTGCVYGGKLTAIELKMGTVVQEVCSNV
ncbi:serine/threonine protein phosphatase 1 [Fervidobacterium changbaicum]|nr:serine/threonine protein phosphatase [Fervidobacterium changbaicum]SDH60108.1 serine/threonine protein phosphatase 1 [Fervidobacterium changbaicum]